MAHPRRAHLIPGLKKMLGKDVPVVFDRKNDIWDTCRRAWLAQDMSCDYAVVIQDDCIATKNFKKKAESILSKHNGDFVFSFFAGQMLKSRIIRAKNHKQDHIVSGMIFNEVAICMQTKHINSMVKYCDDMQSTTDQNITRWARLKRIKILYPIPSLIDHKDDEPSIFREVYNRPNPNKPRKAVIFDEK